MPRLAQCGDLRERGAEFGQGFDALVVNDHNATAQWHKAAMGGVIDAGDSLGVANAPFERAC